MFETFEQLAELCVTDYRISVEYDLSFARQCQIDKETSPA